MERLAREFTPRLRSVLALFDFGNAILFQLFRLPLIGCVQRLAITNAVDRYVEVPVTNALVDHAAPFQRGIFPALAIRLKHGWSSRQPRHRSNLRRLAAQPPTSRDLQDDSARASRR